MREPDKILEDVLFNFLKDVSRLKLLEKNITVGEAQAYVKKWVEKNLGIKDEAS